MFALQYKETFSMFEIYILFNSEINFLSKNYDE